MDIDKQQHSLATYVSDMLALERHIRLPFEKQKTDDDFRSFGAAAELAAELVQTSDQHIERLQRCLQELGGHQASPIKSAVTQVEGVVAAAIDSVRKTKVSKALRDDYTALALCTAGYSALVTTANAMHDSSVASLASNLLRDYAGLIMQIGRALPQVVVSELQAIGLDVDAATVSESQQSVAEAWQQPAGYPA